jgi:hypothetical protein
LFSEDCPEEGGTVDVFRYEGCPQTGDEILGRAARRTSSTLKSWRKVSEPDESALVDGSAAVAR